MLLAQCTQQSESANSSSRYVEKQQVDLIYHVIVISNNQFHGNERGPADRAAGVGQEGGWRDRHDRQPPSSSRQLAVLPPGNVQGPDEAERLNSDEPSGPDAARLGRLQEPDEAGLR